MNKKDINRMLDLADEEYIIETEPGKKHMKNEKETGWAEGIKGVLAAALLFLVFGAAYLAADRLFLTQKEEKEPESDWGQTVKEERDTTEEDDKKETEHREMNQKYASIFKPAENKEIVSRDITLQAGGVEYRYDTIEELTELPFESWGFQEGSGNIYCNETGTPENMFFYLADNEQHRIMTIIITGSGDFCSCYVMDEGTPVVWNGIPVLGYEYPVETDTGTLSQLSLYFRVNGAGYSMECSGMEYGEAGKILDEIIAGALSTDGFDTSKGIKVRNEYKDITLAEAGKLPAFQNYMTDLTRINDLVLEDYQCSYTTGYENDVVVWENLWLEYRNGAYDYIDVTYGTGDFAGKTRVVKVSELTPECIGEYKYPSDVEGNHWYSFTVDFGTGYISILANCREEELWEFLESIKK